MTNHHRCGDCFPVCLVMVERHLRMAERRNDNEIKCQSSNHFEGVGSDDWDGYITLQTNAVGANRRSDAGEQSYTSSHDLVCGACISRNQVKQEPDIGKILRIESYRLGENAVLDWEIDYFWFTVGATCRHHDRKRSVKLGGMRTGDRYAIQAHGRRSFSHIHSSQTNKDHAFVGEIPMSESFERLHRSRPIIWRRSSIDVGSAIGQRS